MCPSHNRQQACFIYILHNIINSDGKDTECQKMMLHKMQRVTQQLASSQLR